MAKLSPAEVVTITIDLAASGFEIAEGALHVHVGSEGYTGTLVFTQLAGYVKGYEATISEAYASITVPADGYQYAIGATLSWEAERVYFTLTGDGSVNLESLRIQFGDKTLWPAHSDSEHLYLRDASTDLEIDPTAAVSTEGLRVYVDMEENGFSYGDDNTMHFHTGGAGVGGELSINNFVGRSDKLPYAMSLANYSEDITTPSTDTDTEVTE